MLNVYVGIMKVLFKHVKWLQLYRNSLAFVQRYIGHIIY